MSSQDIVVCFKNGIERGYNVSEIRRSLLNAGYSSKEVSEAEKDIDNFEKIVKDVPKTRFLPKLPK